MDIQEIEGSNKLTAMQREYIASFGAGFMAILSSQVALCSPSAQKDQETIRTLTIRQEVLLSSLKLDTPERDGLSLLERFLLFEDVSPEETPQRSVAILRAAYRLEKFIDSEIIAPLLQDGFVPTKEQELVVRNIAAIFNKQLEREGTGCLIAQRFAAKLVLHRPEYLSPHVIELLVKSDRELQASLDMKFDFTSEFDTEDVRQLLQLHLRAEFFNIEPNRHLSVQKFWETVANDFASLMRVRTGKEPITNHPEQYEEYLAVQLAARRVDLLKMHLENTV